MFLFFFVFFMLASVHFAFAQSCPGDVNQDGVVDIADFGLLSANYGNTCDEPDQPEYPEGTVHCIPEGADVVEVLSPMTGKTWMDRNLGASRVAQAYDDIESFGDLYQWGRFSDGHQCRDSETTTSPSSSTYPNHPMFITGENSFSDWLIASDDNLWQEAEGINNPCPSNYRLPSISEFLEERDTWSSPNADGAFFSPLKLPTASYRSWTGFVIPFSTAGNYWTQNTFPIGNSIYFSFSTGSGGGSIVSGRSGGKSIRCILDEPPE